ncbi:unnamed protein product [Caretta caretta]
MRQKVAELIPHLLWITFFGTISLCFLVKWGLTPMSRVCSLVAEPNWAHLSSETLKALCKHGSSFASVKLQIGNKA